jgi:hypothetical protein
LTSARGFQVGVILLLIVCFVQNIWWILDSARYATAVRDQALVVLTSDVAQAQALLDAGVAPERVRELFPGLLLEGGVPAPRSDVVERVEATRRQRINRYGWEGSFFLVVLVAGVAVVVRALGEQDRLHRRQQNFIASARVPWPAFASRRRRSPCGTRTSSAASG